MVNSEKKKLKCAAKTTQTSTKKLTDQIKPRAVIIIVLRNVSIALKLSDMMDNDIDSKRV